MVEEPRAITDGWTGGLAAAYASPSISCAITRPMPAPTRSAAPMAWCVAKMPISGVHAEPSTVLASTDGAAPAEKEYCKRKQKGSGSDAGQKRDGHEIEGKGQAAWVRGWWERVLMAQGRYTG